MPGFIDLPPELGFRIAQHLEASEGISLACASRDTLPLGESRSWRSIKVASPAPFGETDEIASEIETMWKQFTGALARRPSRRDHIHSIHCDLTPESLPMLLELISPPCAITHAHINCVYRAEQIPPYHSVISAIALGPPLPHLTHLHIDQAQVGDNDVYACLANTPHVTCLGLLMARHAWVESPAQRGEKVGEGTAVQGQHPHLAKSSSFHLPRLKRLYLHSATWLHAAATIIECAPQLEMLYVQCMGYSDGFGFGEVDAEERRRRDRRALDGILRCKTITRFEAEAIFSRHIYSTEADTAAPDDWLPGLKHLVSRNLVSHHILLVVPAQMQTHVQPFRMVAGARRSRRELTRSRTRAGCQSIRASNGSRAGAAARGICTTS